MTTIVIHFCIIILGCKPNIKAPTRLVCAFIWRVIGVKCILHGLEYGGKGHDVGRIGRNPSSRELCKYMAVNAVDCIASRLNELRAGGGPLLHIDRDLLLERLQLLEEKRVKPSFPQHFHHKGSEVDSRGGEGIVPLRVARVEQNISRCGGMFGRTTKVNQLKESEEPHASEVSGGIFPLEAELAPAAHSLLGFQTRPQPL